MPLTAWLLATGQSSYIDSTYLITVLGFVFLGALWLGQYCLHVNLTPASGLAFALVPAVLVSIDRFTVDAALAALCIGFAVEKRWRLFLVLMLAPLARETGLVLPAAFALHSIFQKNWKGIAMAVSAIVPYAAWLVYLEGRKVTASLAPFMAQNRSSNGLRRCHRNVVRRRARRLPAPTAAIQLVRKRRHSIHAHFCGFVSQPQIWADSDSFARTMSPLLIFLALIGIANHFWLYLAPIGASARSVPVHSATRGILHGLRTYLGA